MEREARYPPSDQAGGYRPLASIRPTKEERLRATLSRRSVLGGLGAAPLITSACATGEEAAPASRLPVRATFLEHMGTVVQDVRAATMFHSTLFNPAIMTEMNPTPLRCYVDLSPGYLAFGSRANATTSFFDHYCVLIEDYDQEEIAAALGEVGLPQNNPAFTLFQDTDGIGVQFYGHPGGWFPTVIPMARMVEGPPLVTPHGLEHVMLYVKDVDTALEFYRPIFGSIDARDGDTAWLEFPDTRLGLRRVPDFGYPGVDHIRVRVSPFDAAEVGDAIEAMGAMLGESSDGDPNVLAFTDPQGLKLELMAV
jgi:catechol 2,3-dioxygenase-like lactoylglutathione lyase family enzyme